MRIELIHPMLVHFPIALLVTGCIMRCVAIWAVKRSISSFLLPASWVILFLGVIFAWLAVVAGEIAREIVEPTIKNVKILNAHEMHAYITAYGFTIGLFTDWARAFFLIKLQKNGWIIKKGISIIIGFIYLFSLTNLIITGNYGARLVYEEGAAVEMTPPQSYKPNL